MRVQVMGLFPVTLRVGALHVVALKSVVTTGRIVVIVELAILLVQVVLPTLLVVLVVP